MCIMNDYAWTIIFWPIWRFCPRIHVSGVICLCSEINDHSQLDTHTTCVFKVNSKSQENVQPLYSIVKLLKDVWNMNLNQKNLPQLCGNLIYITNPAHAEMYSVQINVINFFTDFGGSDFLITCITFYQLHSICTSDCSFYYKITTK